VLPTPSKIVSISCSLEIQGTCR